MKVNHLLAKSKNSKKHTQDTSLITGNYIVTENDITLEEKVVIHYTVNKKSAKQMINSFEEETITRR